MLNKNVIWIFGVKISDIDIDKLRKAYATHECDCDCDLCKEYIKRQEKTK